MSTKNVIFSNPNDVIDFVKIVEKYPFDMDNNYQNYCMMYIVDHSLNWQIYSMNYIYYNIFAIISIHYLIPNLFQAFQKSIYYLESLEQNKLP